MRNRRPKILTVLPLLGVSFLVGFGVLVLQCESVRMPGPRFPAPAGPPVPEVFAVIGDYGRAGLEEEAVARLVRSWRPAYIVTTGDNNYTQGAASTIDLNIGAYYHEFIGGYHGDYGPDTTRANHFFPCLGNHDIYTANGQPYLDYFALPGNERYYRVRQGAVEWFVLNSNQNEPDGTSPTAAQGKWLRQRLAASRAPWRLVVFHHPPYSSGEHGNADWMAWPYRAWGASAVIAGHDHTYERLLIDGLPYVVNGLGGNSRYAFTHQTPGSLVRYDADFGALRGRADSTRLALTFITIGGQTIDSLVLTR